MNKNEIDDLSRSLIAMQSILHQLKQVPRPIRLSLHNVTQRMEYLIRKNLEPNPKYCLQKKARIPFGVIPALQIVLQEKRIQYPEIKMEVKYNISDNSHSLVCKIPVAPEVLENFFAFCIDSLLMQCQTTEQYTLLVTIQKSKIIFSLLAQLPLPSTTKIIAPQIQEKARYIGIATAITMNRNAIHICIDLAFISQPVMACKNDHYSQAPSLMHFLLEKSLARYNS